MKTIFIKRLSPIRYLLLTKSGFTIIELLVTISIIAIIFGLSVAKYNEFNRRQIVVQAANELRSNLRLAQNKATSGEKDCSRAVDGGCGGTTDGCGNDTDGSEKSLDGWYASFTGSSYQIYGQCGGDVTFPDSPKTVNLFDKGIAIDTSISDPIHFYPLGLGVEEEATINLSNDGTTETVVVSKAGEID